MFWKQLKEFSRTLGFRLNLWHAVIYLITAILPFALTYFLLGAAIDRKDRDVIEARLREYLAVYENGGVPALRDWSARINEARRQRMFFVRVARPDRTVLLLVMPDDWYEQDVQLLDRQSELRPEDWIRLPRDQEVDLTVASLKLQDGTVFQVGRSSDSREKLLARFRQVFAMVIPPVVLLGFIGGALLTRRMTRPICRLVDAASHIVETGRMDVRVPARKSDDELQDLVVIFNRMLESNEELLRALRESLDNVAHDLRTPITRLRVTLENSLSAGDGVAAVKERVADALEETDRVQTIITTLMDVAEAETGAMRLHIEQTDLRALIEDVVELYDHVAQEKQITVINNFDEPHLVSVDAARMRQVFANLLDNALKYTPPRGKVTITAKDHDACVDIFFRDTGPGIAEADLPRIWERLYRGDKSRSEHGLGLGLSLVKAIVEAHRGGVAAENVDGNGAEFRVSLPKARPAHAA